MGLMRHIWVSREADTDMSAPGTDTDMSQPRADTDELAKGKWTSKKVLRARRTRGQTMVKNQNKTGENKSYRRKWYGIQRFYYESWISTYS